jgi:hypothetical protein
MIAVQDNNSRTTKHGGLIDSVHSSSEHYAGATF